MELRNRIFKVAFEWLCQNRNVKDQSDLARITGIGANTISLILNGKSKVSGATIRRLNEAFDNVFNIEWLMGDEFKPMLAADVKPIKRSTGKKNGNNDNLAIAIEAKQEVIDAMHREIAVKDQIITLLKSRIEELENKTKRHDSSYSSYVSEP